MFGQFWNQTTLKWDWQQIGGNPQSVQDAKDYAESFASTYGVCTKLVGRYRTIMYLPPVADEGQALTWPTIDATMIQTQPARAQ